MGLLKKKKKQEEEDSKIMWTATALAQRAEWAQSIITHEQYNLEAVLASCYSSAEKGYNGVFCRFLTDEAHEYFLRNGFKVTDEPKGGFTINWRV